MLRKLDFGTLSLACVAQVRQLQKVGHIVNLAAHPTRAIQHSIESFPIAVFSSTEFATLATLRGVIIGGRNTSPYSETFPSLPFPLSLHHIISFVLASAAGAMVAVIHIPRP